MPSPIAHLAAGYAVYYVSQFQRPEPVLGKIGPFSNLLLLTLGVSILPDIDSVAGIISGDFGRYHNNLTHSLFVGLGVSLFIGNLMTRTRKFKLWFLISFICYGLHVLMDSATVGRGVMAVWPFSSERYMTRIPLFYGLHWSDGWLSYRHFYTLVTELVFAALLITGAHLVVSKNKLARG